MMRKLLQRWLPDRETLGRYQLTRRFAPFLTHPRLWSIRRSLIAGGLAVGLFCAMIPGPLQMLAAMSLAILFRVNLPVAVLGTFCSNPVTILPLYFVAYLLGQWCLGVEIAHQLPAFPSSGWDNPAALASAWADWMLAQGAPLATGIVVLACLMAISAYALVQVSWRLNVMRAVWQRRYNRPHLRAGRSQ